MKRFCLKSLYFFLPIVVSAILFEFALRIIPNDYVYKKELLTQRLHQIETLILGGSHTYTGLDPIFFENPKTFNAAYYSQSLYFDCEIFNKYQAQMSQLKTIIIPLSYPSLFTRFSQAESYFLYCDIDAPTGFLDKTEIFGKEFSSNIKRFFRYYIKRESLISTTELGWGTLYKAEESKDLIALGKETAERHTRGMYPNLVKGNEDLINTLIDFCKQRNIHVFLITTPTYRTYRENLNTEYLNTTITVGNNIAQRHENCTYINLHEDASFVAEDFYDGDHLNNIGAKKLSLKVNKILEEHNEKSNLVTNNVY